MTGRTPWHNGNAVRKAGVMYHPRHEEALALGESIADRLSQLQVRSWTFSAFDDGNLSTELPDTDLLISVGGDGTILKAARSVLQRPVPILGVNYGKIGFMAELAPSEVLRELPKLLDGEGWLEERAMLTAWIADRDEDPPEQSPLNAAAHALNDIVVARTDVGRPIGVSVEIDGEVVVTYRGDAVIVATATGSTGYSLSAGGPILPPQSTTLVVTPVSPHLSLNNSILIPPTALISLTLSSEHVAAMSVDGQGNQPLTDGQRVVIRQSPYVTHFLRLRPPSYFYRALRYHLSPHADPLWTEGDLR
jgi:NAD+ kinase